MRLLNSLFIVALLFVMQSAFGQVAKNVIVEHFTNTNCSICANANKNPAFYTNLEAHPDALHISYHPSSPYASCVLSQHNPSENDGRTNYYNIYGSTPKLVVQGVLTPSNVAFGSADVFSAYENQTSEVSISIVQTKVSDQSIEATITITGEADHSYTNAKLLVGVAEKLVNYSAPNGEQEHHDVFRKAMTDIAGDAISLPAVGESISLTFSVDHHEDWDFDQMFSYAILSDGDTQEVIQSQAALPSDNVTTTSIGETNFLQDLALYPNPVNDWLSIRLDLAKNTIAQIFDVSGQLLLETNFDSEVQMDVSNLAKGIYLLEIKNEEGKAIRKFIKE